MTLLYESGVTIEQGSLRNIGGKVLEILGRLLAARVEKGFSRQLRRRFVPNIASVLCFSTLAACAPADGARVQSAAAPAPDIDAPNPRNQPFVLVVLGDSLSQGYGLVPEQALPAQLQVRLHAAGANVDVRNAGVSRDTSAQALARFDQAVIDDANGVIIEFGANDMLQGRQPAEVRANLAALIARAKARHIWVGLVGMRAPPQVGVAYQTAFDRIYPELAREQSIPLYPFYYEGLIDSQTGATRRNLFLPDRVHPTAEGVEIVADGMASWLRQTLPVEVTSSSH